MNIKEICFYSIEKSSQAQRIKTGQNFFVFNILNPKKFVNLSFNFAAQKKAYKVHEMVVLIDLIGMFPLISRVMVSAF